MDAHTLLRAYDIDGVEDIIRDLTRPLTRDLLDEHLAIDAGVTATFWRAAEDDPRAAIEQLYSTLAAAATQALGETGEGLTFGYTDDQLDELADSILEQRAYDCAMNAYIDGTSTINPDQTYKSAVRF